MFCATSCRIPLLPDPEPARLHLGPAYALAGPVGQRSRLAALTRLVCALPAPATFRHAPEPAPTRGGRFARELAGRARPRGTQLFTAVLPADPDQLLRPARGVPPWPAVTDERAAVLGLDTGAWAQLLALTRWPASIPGDWLADLAGHAGVLAVVLHLVPLDPAVALRLLQRRAAALLSSAAVGAAAGELADPRAGAAVDTARELAGRVARGQTALLRGQLLVAVHGPDPGGAAEAGRGVRRRLAGLLGEARVLRFEQSVGWRAAAPAGLPLSRPWRVLDAESVAATVPHPVGLPVGDRGLLAGVDPATGMPLLLDRAALANPARLVVGTSGAGKSFAAKLEVHRWLRAGGTAVVVDPEGEFGPELAPGPGLVVRLGSDPAGLDPVGTACSPQVSATEGLGLLAGLAAALTGGPLEPVDLGSLDAALTGLRAHAAGTPKELLRAVREAGSPRLAARLAPAAAGSLGGLFAANPALADPPPLVVFDLRDVPAPARPAVTSCVLGWAWTRRRAGTGGPSMLLVVDEAHLLLDSPAAADLLAQFARRARKYGVALELVTQRLSDFLGCPQGRAILATAASALLLGCAAVERAAVQDSFGLTDAETALLEPGRAGRGLLLAGPDRVAIHVVASPAEFALAAGGPRP